MEIYIENNPIIPLSPGACLRVAASAKEGERSLTLQSFSDGAEGVKGLYHVHPHLNRSVELTTKSSPIKGRTMYGNFYGLRVTNPSNTIYLDNIGFVQKKR